MTSIQRKFLLWAALPILWMLLWSTVCYFWRQDVSGSDTEISSEFSLFRIHFVIVCTFAIGFSRYFFLSEPTDSQRTSSLPARIITNIHASKFIPETLVVFLYLWLSFLLATLTSSMEIFWISIGTLLCFEIPTLLLQTRIAGNTTRLESEPATENQNLGASNDRAEALNPASDDLQEPVQDALPDSLTGENQSPLEESNFELSNESLLASVASEEIDQEECEESWSGQLTVQIDDQQVRQQWVWVYHWKPDETQKDLHFQFTPMFDTIPKMEVSVVDGPGQANVEQTQIQGTRISLRKSPQDDYSIPTTLVATASGKAAVSQ